MDEWCKSFKFINYIDCYDGRHPNTFVPNEAPHPQFNSIEDINNYLLQHKEVLDYVRVHGRNPKAVFLMFDEATERLARQVGLKVWFPPARLRNRVDNKINTVRIGNQAGVPSVPNVLATVRSYDELRRVAKDLGPDLVVQSAFGDSGHTTFFISTERDWRRHAGEIVDAGEVKIMKRIRCRGSADRGLRDQARHHRRPLDDRAGRLQGADALPGRLVRQRDLRRTRSRPRSARRRAT